MHMHGTPLHEVFTWTQLSVKTVLLCCSFNIAAGTSLISMHQTDLVHSLHLPQALLHWAEHQKLGCGPQISSLMRHASVVLAPRSFIEAGTTACMLQAATRRARPHARAGSALRCCGAGACAYCGLSLLCMLWLHAARVYKGSPPSASSSRTARVLCVPVCDRISRNAVCGKQAIGSA